MEIVVVMLGLVLAGGSGVALSGAEADPPLPAAEVQRLVQELRAVMRQAVAKPDELVVASYARADRLLPVFLAILDRLGGQPLPEPDDGAPTLERTLHRAAVAYHQDSGRWHELLRIYGRPAPGSEEVIVVEPRSLDVAHQGPEFQPFWQLALLAPRTEALELMKRRSYEALAEGRSAEAVPVFAWRLAQGEDADALIDCLDRLDQDASLEAVVSGLHAVGATPPALAAARRALGSLVAADPGRRAILADMAAREPAGPIQALLRELLAAAQ